MSLRIQKWGNSQGLRLPKQALDLAGIAIGDAVEIEVSDHQIVIKKAVRARYDLAELVAQIPKGYKAHEVAFGPPSGREAW